MLRAARHRLVLAVLLSGLAFGTGLRSAAPPGSPPRPSQPPMPPDSPPRLPPAPNPIDRFRELLALDAAGREQSLATRTPAQRAYLQARLAEFDRLTPAERELRLQLLTLRHYVLPLLRTAPTNRAESLRLVPTSYRDIVRERLAVWDRLTPAEQEERLQNESVFTGLPLIGGASPTEQQAARSQLVPERRRQLEADLARWQTLPAAERERVSEWFQTFLTLDDREQQKTLAQLDAARRAKASRLLRALEELPADKRAKSLEAFRRFSALSPSEREKFLRNTARWQAMSPAEQQAWRRLRAELPPAPPGLNQESPPPMPPELPSARPPLTNTSAAR